VFRCRFTPAAEKCVSATNPMKAELKGLISPDLTKPHTPDDPSCCAVLMEARKPFVEKVKSLLIFKARGRDVIGGVEGYHLREAGASCKALFEAEKDDIGPENAYL